MSLLNSLKHFVANTGEDQARMLMKLSALAWILSSASQIAAIAWNNKLSKKEKSFLIPQEMFDGAVNVGLFLTLTQGFISGTKALINKDIIKLKKPAGNPELYHSPVVMIASIVGGVIAGNILTPIIRNYLGARMQKRLMDNHVMPFQNERNEMPKPLHIEYAPISPVTMNNKFLYPTTMGTGVNRI